MTTTVCVFRRDGRKFYECQWVDPDTGRKKTRPTGTDRKRDAERFAGNLEKELRQGTYREPQRTTRAAFRQRFGQEEFPRRRKTTRDQLSGTLNLVEWIIYPATLASMTQESIGRFAATMREELREEASVRSRLSDIRPLLCWPHRQRLIPPVPSIDMPETSGTSG